MAGGTASSTIGDVFGGRSVLVTGHTGFKGAWLCLWLESLGARVTGFSNGIPTSPSGFELMRIGNRTADVRGEITDLEALEATMREAAPSVIFHLAAQAIVREGFKQPHETFATNVMGTVAVLEAARRVPGVGAVVVVTSDKVYDNQGSVWGYRENDPLGGHEPYGTSKAAAEMAVMAYRSAGFHKAAGSPNRPAIAAARAGNVIGGGDWARDRLIPDFVRAIAEGRDQEIRQPGATRPWQHVLEPLGGYLMLAAALLEDAAAAPAAVNFGPGEPSAPNVEEVARAFLDHMKPAHTRLIVNEVKDSGEARALRVDSSLAEARLGWRPCWCAMRAIEETARWYEAHLRGGEDMRAISQAQLTRYRAESPVAALR